MRLFDISEEFKALFDIMENDCEVNEETGEVTNNDEIIAEMLASIHVSFEKKLDNCAYIIKQLAVSSEALKEEAKRLTARASTLSNNSDKLKDMMSVAMISSCEEKVKTDKFTFSFRKSESVEIDDIMTPEDFDRRYIKIVRTYDKTKIKTALKSGEVIAGATIKINQNFQIK